MIAYGTLRLGESLEHKAKRNSMSALGMCAKRIKSTGANLDNPRLLPPSFAFKSFLDPLGLEFFVVYYVSSTAPKFPSQGRQSYETFNGYWKTCNTQIN